MSWAAIGTAVVGSVVTGGISYGISQANQPKQPDLASSSAELSNANAQMLPIRRKLEAAAQQGGKVTLNVPQTVTTRQVFIPTLGPDGQPQVGKTGTQAGQWANYNAQDFAPGGKYAQYASMLNGAGNKLQYRTSTQQVTAPHVVDFTGLGTADVQGKIADEMAKIQLGLSQKYDPQFIAQALEQENEADPESFAARQKMSDLIQQQINATPERPVAELLNKQIGDQLSAAQEGKLDPQMQTVLDKSVAEALADRGGTVDSGADFSTPLTSGFAGEQRQQQAAQKAIGWLSSGATPEDTEYRREQQNLANLSAEVNGQTPQSEFKSLSGAQSGPTPFVQGQPLATMPTGQAGAAQGAALSNWNTQMGAAQNQVSPWISGISGALNIGQLLGAAGYKPLASTGAGAS